MKRYFLSIIGLCLSICLQSQVQIGGDINGTAINDALGWSVATSGDGQTIVVGAPNSSINGDSSGQIIVYQFNGANWIQLGNAIDNFSESDNSGRSVDITDDGTTLIIGAQYSDLSEPNAGSVQVFVYDGMDWVHKGNTLNGSGNGHEFGTSVSISNDGNRIAIGAAYFSTNANDSGALKVFDYDGSQWNLTYTSEGDSENDVFGMSVDMSGDGNHVICGGWINEDANLREGYVKVFNFQNSTWSQVGATISGETPGIYFGAASAISDDGNRVAVGSWGNNENGNFSGEVEVFELNANVWQPLGLDIQGDSGSQRFGWSIDLSGNGEVLAIGAYQANYTKIYRLENNNWNQIGNTLFGVNGNDEFGYSVDLTSDGTKIVIGDPSNDNNASYAGFAQVYDITDLLSVSEFESDLFQVFPNPVNDRLAIKSNQVIDELSVIDINGKILKEIKLYNLDYSLDISSLNDGVYFIEIQSGKSKTIKKFIKS